MGCLSFYTASGTHLTLQLTCGTPKTLTSPVLPVRVNSSPISHQHTCTAKSLNGEKFTLLHLHSLLPSSDYGYTLAAMYVVCIDGVPIQVPDTLNLQCQHWPPHGCDSPPNMHSIVHLVPERIVYASQIAQLCRSYGSIQLCGECTTECLHSCNTAGQSVKHT